MQINFKCFTRSRKCCKGLVTPKGKATTSGSQKLHKTLQMEWNRGKMEMAMRLSNICEARQNKSLRQHVPLGRPVGSGLRC